MVESSCNCGERVLIETDGLHRADGKRPHYPESGPGTTVLRCRACHGWLAETCPDAAFAQPEPPQ